MPVPEVLTFEDIKVGMRIQDTAGFNRAWDVREKHPTYLFVRRVPTGETFTLTRDLVDDIAFSFVEVPVSPLDRAACAMRPFFTKILDAIS